MITCTFENGSVATHGLRHISANAIILKDGKVLLGKRGFYHGKPLLEFGKWGPIGGYVDRDETLVEAVKREVMEESGYELDDIKLFRINDYPYRPKEDKQNIDMIFIATATTQKSVKCEETLELKWFDLDHLPPKDQIAFDYAEALELYIKYLDHPEPLPLLG
jgi:ADP-ribose pyrophosphatase YjhB (NUDIX family)